MRFKSDKQRRAVFASMNKFSGDSVFARRARDRWNHSDIMSEYEIKQGGYYEEPATAPVKIPHLGRSKVIYKVDKRPTAMEYDLVKKPSGGKSLMYETGTPVYESDYFNNIVIDIINEETGKEPSELIDEGKLTPLTIEDLSNRVRKQVVKQMEMNDYEGLKERIASGREAPDFDRGGNLNIDVVSEDEMLEDARKEVVGFLKSVGYKKDKGGIYVPPSVLNKDNSVDWIPPEGIV